MFLSCLVHECRFIKMMHEASLAPFVIITYTSDIHALKSICGRLADKESAFHTEHP